jgi:hypothetical protein
VSTLTEPRPDRVVPGRFVRNLALSLSGGALLTVVGAAVASADEVGTSSDGAGVTGTGDATAVGNSSGTSTNQGVAPSGGASNPAVVTQTATVPHVGIAVANTGGNVAVGNGSANTDDGTQTAEGGAVATSNSGRVGNVSDGTAVIRTGDAAAYGNVSTTSIDQGAHGALGILTSQDAFVVNAGVGVADTGLNSATGNTSVNTAGFVQTATNPNGLATNSASSTNASNGSATIVSGAASATGNKSETWIDQTAGGTGDDDHGGLLVIDQLGIVANVGAALANTGGNLAVGNASTNDATGNIQTATIAPDVTALLPTVASNQLEVENGSDGEAAIDTGDATAVGNDSSTNLTQASYGDPDTFGAILSTQVAGVANIGIGAANTGLNVAIGNVSINDAVIDQTAAVGVDPLASILGVTASNSARVGTTSDGHAKARTGNASATGNHSATELAQESHAAIDGTGVLPNLQVAGVLNAGAAVASSGVNAAVGNAAGQTGPDTATLTQFTTIDGDPGPIFAVGPVTAFNDGEASTVSNGTAFVVTGNATATGNSSATAIHQHLDTSVEGMGLVIAPQVGTVANLGLAVANSGVNAAVGNASQNTAVTDSEADFDPLASPTTVIGPITVGNSTSATNDSDGEACVCTGDATASGNVSRTTLTQDLDLTAEDGLLVVPTTGVVLNAGFGLANSGVNLAVGNLSQNTATLAEQDAELGDAPAVLVGPQTIVNGGGSSNTSDGAAKVGSGRATAVGNLSETNLVQAATVDGASVIAQITSTVANAGAGVANSGLNLGIGNASVNDATLAQSATGVGTVSNQGEAGNDSDGTAIINHPCEDEKVTPQPPTPQPPGEPEVTGQPAVASLPRTGGAIETMAAVALMLLLAGFAAHGTSRRRLAAA